jgi:hypothetical protein
MAAGTRSELERVLLTEAVNRRSFGFLEKENITPDHFEGHKELATPLWGEQALPSRRQVEDWEESTIADWTPDPDGVVHAIEGVREFHAQDQVHRELYDMKKILGQDRVNGWKTIMEEVPSRLNAIRDNLEAGKASSDDLLPWLDIEEAIKSGIKETEHLIRGVVLAGQSHVLFAPGDSGKSWIAMWITKEAIERGLTVIYFDFENTPGKFLQRMNILGASKEDMARFIKYTYAPQLTLKPEATCRFGKVLDTVKPDLIVWDSWMGPLGMCQIKENDNDDIRHWATKYIDPAKDRGIATVLLDHTGHENTDRNHLRA